MKRVIEKATYFALTLFIFIVLWKIVGELWDVFVPWNYKTDLFGIFVVTPVLIVASLIFASFSFKVIKETK